MVDSNAGVSTFHSTVKGDSLNQERCTQMTFQGPEEACAKLVTDASKSGKCSQKKWACPELAFSSKMTGECQVKTYMCSLKDEKSVTSGARRNTEIVVLTLAMIVYVFM